jgi:hypothetical protein
MGNETIQGKVAKSLDPLVTWTRDGRTVAAGPLDEHVKISDATMKYTSRSLVAAGRPVARAAQKKSPGQRGRAKKASPRPGGQSQPRAARSGEPGRLPNS